MENKDILNLNEYSNFLSNVLNYYNSVESVIDNTVKLELFYRNEVDGYL